MVLQKKIVRTTCSFDGNDSLKFDISRKQNFINYYNLELLFIKLDLGISQEFLVAPNGAVLCCLETSDDPDQLFEFSLLRGRYKTMTELVELLTTPNVIVDFEELVNLMVGLDCKYFIPRKVCYELAKQTARTWYNYHYERCEAFY